MKTGYWILIIVAAIVLIYGYKQNWFVLKKPATTTPPVTNGGQTTTLTVQGVPVPQGRFTDLVVDTLNAYSNPSSNINDNRTINSPTPSLPAQVSVLCKGGLFNGQYNWPSECVRGGGTY